MTAAASSEGTASTQIGWQGAELVLTRVFHAPRELVFRAWTDQEHWARWFGPHGSTLPFCRLDARPGGTLHYQHHFPDYPDVWIRGTYTDVAPRSASSSSAGSLTKPAAAWSAPAFPGR